MKTIEEKTKVIELLNEIKDKSLQQVLREVIFSGGNVFDALKKYRPETNMDSFIYDEIDPHNYK